jgi:DNA replication protein DnaC
MTNHLMLMPEPEEEPFEEEEEYPFDDGPRTGKGFENLGSIHTVVLPPVVFERLGGKATLEEALWTCPTCGPIRPFAYANGFLPGRCACQRRAQEREQRLKVYAALQEQGQANRKRQCARCYTWLGDEWSEAGLEERTFAAFQRGLQPQAYDTAKAFAEHQRGNILFIGSYGTGKTHLAAAICNQLCDEFVVCRFTTGQGLFDAIGHCISTKQDYHHLIAEAANVPVLVIDDIDKTYLPSSTDGRFQTRTFFDILDKRYKKKLPTIITSNEDDITPYVGKASFSRLQVGLVMRIMDGADYRIKLLGE